MNKKYSGMTQQMIVNEQVQAMCRRDGGPLCRVEIWHKNGAHGFETYDPQTARSVKFDVEFSGGSAEITYVR